MRAMCWSAEHSIAMGPDRGRDWNCRGRGPKSQPDTCIRMRMGRGLNMPGLLGMVRSAEYGSIRRDHPGWGGAVNRNRTRPMEYGVQN